MSNRDYKEFSEGTIAHIYNRGNGKNKIFIDEQDYRAFLFRLGLTLGIEVEELNKSNITSTPSSRIRIEGLKKSFKIHAFCLMPNHFHLIIEQLGEVPISRLISKLCTSYAKYINQKYDKVGHVFQDKFKSVVVNDDPQLMWVSAYIHMNPVKDRLVSKPEKYKWSSYRYIIESIDTPIINSNLLIKKFGNAKNLEKETLAFDVKDGL